MMAPSDPSDSGPPASLAGLKILVVEDDKALRLLTAAYLRRAGATVHLAADGHAALELLRGLSTSGEAPNCILCDFRMDGGSGIELFDAISVEMPGLERHIVFASGDLEAVEIRAFLAKHQVPVLAKPYPMTELRRLLRDARFAD